MEERPIPKLSDADLEMCENADSFLQSAMWGRFKARFGWEAHVFAVDWNAGSRPLLVLSRRLAPGISMAYIPWGPELPENFPCDPALRASATLELARALRPFLPKPVAFIRFDPAWEKVEGGELPAPFKRAAADIQPPDTVIVDLSCSEEALLAGMKPKWRYNVALAQKRGVCVKEDGEQGIDTFYRLLGETAARDGIAIHSGEYYRALFQECKENRKTDHCPPQSLKLYTAWHEGDALAAIVALFRGNKAVYLYGASANIKRNLMATYALQWRAMQEAKAFGCTQYDLFGIPPNENPDHPMSGLYRFKTGFGGRIVHRNGSWDYPCKPVLCALFSGAEHLRKKLRYRRKK
jgi:lipid II:glycine glycyltransferase (peptidoglycan interpeptide bridge formation enzyme)